MPKFNYRARDSAGAPLRGTVEAEDVRTAVVALRARGMVVTGLQPQRPSLVSGVKIFARSRVPLDRLAAVCRQVSTMISVGVPILTVLRLISKQTDHQYLAQILREAAAGIEAGERLSEALRKHERYLPPVMINLVAAGEAGGTLDEVFNQLAETFEKEDAAVRKVRTAMFYPAIVGALSISVIIFLLVFVIPSYTRVFMRSGVELPLPTRAVLSMSDFFTAFWPWLLAWLGLIILGLGLARRKPGFREATDRLILNLPLVGALVVKRDVGRLARTASALLRSGLPIINTLVVVEGILGNRAMAGVVAEATSRVGQGRTLTEPFRESPFYPDVFVEMVSVGEETGALDTLLDRVSRYYEAELDRDITRLTTLVEPVMILFLGGVVALVVLAIVMPMFEMMTLTGQ